MSHVKAGGTAKNVHNNAGQRLGVKRFGGQKVKNGEVLVRLRDRPVAALVRGGLRGAGLRQQYRLAARARRHAGRRPVPLVPGVRHRRHRNEDAPARPRLGRPQAGHADAG